MQNSKATEEFQNMTGLPKWQPGFFVKELIMTLKKSKRGQAIKGQSILEYFILTTVVVTVVLFFASTPYFQSIRTSCANAFDRAVEGILK